MTTVIPSSAISPTPTTPSMDWPTMFAVWNATDLGTVVTSSQSVPTIDVTAWTCESLSSVSTDSMPGRTSPLRTSAGSGASSAPAITEASSALTIVVCCSSNGWWCPSTCSLIPPTRTTTLSSSPITGVEK